MTDLSFSFFNFTAVKDKNEDGRGLSGRIYSVKIISEGAARRVFVEEKLLQKVVKRQRSSGKTCCCQMEKSDEI